MKKKVAFQGDHGAYSEIATKNYFKKDVVTVPCEEFEQVFKKVISGAVHFGVLPIENALTGSIHQNYDLLIKHNVWICGEYKQKISHHLLAPKSSTLKSIQRVYSHPQALEQCEGFFKKHRRLEPTPFFDTAGSARFVSENNSGDIAAIASAEAGQYYKLKSFAKDIQDNPNNFTRFIVITKKSASQTIGTGKDVNRLRP